MSAPYILTIHIAEGGTPTFNSDTKVWEDAKDTSTAGHMWYSIREGEGDNAVVHSFGFAPQDGKSGLTAVPGKVFPSDNDTYHQPLYARSMEISQEQYEKLLKFGQDGMKEKWIHGFESKYHSLHNSCVDFTWKALEDAGFVTGGYEGALKPRNNRDEIDQKIIDPIPGSKHNQTRHGPPAEEVSAALRKERAEAFKEDPKKALERFPEYAPLHQANEALEAVKTRFEKFKMPQRDKDQVIAVTQKRLANMLEAGHNIPSSQHVVGAMIREVQAHYGHER